MATSSRKGLLSLETISRHAVKIANVQAVALEFGERRATGKRRASWTAEARVGSPMAPYPRYAEIRSSWTPSWPGVGVVVTADERHSGPRH